MTAVLKDSFSVSEKNAHAQIYNMLSFKCLLCILFQGLSRQTLEQLLSFFIVLYSYLFVIDIINSSLQPKILNQRDAAPILSFN